MTGRELEGGSLRQCVGGEDCEWAMEIEEEGIVDESVPERCRVRGADLTFDFGERSMKIRCLRRVSEGCKEMAVREVHLTW